MNYLNLWITNPDQAIYLIYLVSNHHSEHRQTADM